MSESDVQIITAGALVGALPQPETPSPSTRVRRGVRITRTGSTRAARTAQRVALRRAALGTARVLGRFVPLGLVLITIADIGSEVADYVSKKKQEKAFQQGEDQYRAKVKELETRRRRADSLARSAQLDSLSEVYSRNEAILGGQDILAPASFPEKNFAKNIFPAIFPENFGKFLGNFLPRGLANPVFAAPKILPGKIPGKLSQNFLPSNPYVPLPPLTPREAALASLTGSQVVGVSSSATENPEAAPQPQQNPCRQVKGRRTKKGDCDAGFFRDSATGGTQFITWRKKCQASSRKRPQLVPVSP